jgi:hypothetical protein
MARSIINNDAVSGENFLPGQLFVFGGFALRANSIGRLEQIDSYAPGHQISFGNLNYVADIRRDLIFEGFTAPTTALALDPEQITGSGDGSLEPAGLSAIMELTTGDPEETASSASPESNRIPFITVGPDSSPDSKSELLSSMTSKHGQEAFASPSAKDFGLPVQSSPLNEALDLMRSLAIIEESLPNYA